MKKENKKWEATSYANLSEKEKDSDREQVDRYIPLLKSFICQLLDEQKQELIKDFRAELEASLSQQKQEFKRVVEGKHLTVYRDEKRQYVNYKATEYNQALKDILKELENL